MTWWLSNSLLRCARLSPWFKKEYLNVLHIFTHWTFHVSKGRLMVTDLQGGFENSGERATFYLTDSTVLNDTDVLMIWILRMEWETFFKHTNAIHFANRCVCQVSAVNALSWLVMSRARTPPSHGGIWWDRTTNYSTCLDRNVAVVDKKFCECTFWASGKKWGYSRFCPLQNNE